MTDDTKYSTEAIKKLFNLRQPHDWSLVIGCKGVSAQIPDEEKWCGLTPEATHLFVKEFVPHYHGSTLVPPWDYWLKYGVGINSASGVVLPFEMILNVHGQDVLMKHLGRSMPRYLKYEVPTKAEDPFPDAVPMPGAGQTTPGIKDVKGERLD
jgi:hypothetical protein